MPEILERVELLLRDRRSAAAALTTGAAHIAEHAGEALHAALADLLHHVGHVAVHLQHLVDLGHIDAGASRNTAFARGLQEIRLAALLRRHRHDDCFLALEHLVVDARGGHLLLGVLHARQQVHHAAEAAHALHLAQLASKIFQVELTLLHLLGDALGFGDVDLGLGALDQRDDVAPPQNAAGDAAGVEHVEAVDLFTHADEADRQAGDRTHRQGCAATAIAVHAGEHKAGERQAFVETFGRLDRVLTRESVSDKQRFIRLGDGGNLGRLVHHLVVERGAARRIQHEHIVAAELRSLDGAAGDVGRQLAGDDWQGIDADLVSENLELFHRRRAARVERGDEHFLALSLLEAFGELARRGGFARALQARHHDDRGR